MGKGEGGGVFFEIHLGNKSSDFQVGISQHGSILSQDFFI